MADRRPPRQTALRANDAFVAAASSDDEGGRQTRSRRTGPRVDLGKLDTMSLLRYRKVYKLGDAPATATKEDLLPAVSRHFAQQVVDEEEVLLKFVLAVQKHNKQMQQRQLNAALQKQQLTVAQMQQMQIQMQQHAQYQIQRLGALPPQAALQPQYLKGAVMKPQQQRR
ncbi:hypothetical protein CHLRE_01g051450v5 [Chlamydomonas reinhardtii]|uniref:Histone deacetylase complex subunit SAP30 Sin3 binding domain-containing protein n=1 Tax=Chlamydomonas reinhardtii TaxID=3055 RepID=A8HNG7_CHLRE|nr:uncharacterized protein CHLRE_01g051450v5 [Chlamydomonas reinhardtii]XP_042928887.1 uncharacterized protein CHLRE_01g051450v5 [Chlamydomonas reinhardtii]PNW88941.1 hypothetical protein CHLRE_01g051450v5 [Chlamydomonas reinhardtii]PNW88942.1 hypothetical protein CHLRE_01g051450v5 [Chlamydomonas reinhardtii]|eukprot:XP_001690251.1 predicted protein [Chlamydomonas reinhardtii]